jgi:hypothetical protein
MTTSVDPANPDIWRRTIPLYPPVVEDKTVLKEFIKVLCIKSGTVLSEKIVNDVISSFGGCFLLYTRLFDWSPATSTSVERDLNSLKEKHTGQLKSALNLYSKQSFSVESLERYELLQAVARGEKIRNQRSRAARYLLTKHEEIQPFLGIHPEGHLTLALPMTRQSLKDVEHVIDTEKRFVNFKSRAYVNQRSLSK